MPVTFPLTLTLSPRGEGMNGILPKFHIWHYVHLVVVFFPSYLAPNQRFRHFGSRPPAGNPKRSTFFLDAGSRHTVSGMTTVATSELLQCAKLSDFSGRHDYCQHHPCNSESAVGGRRIFWVEPPSEILRRPPSA